MTSILNDHIMLRVRTVFIFVVCLFFILPVTAQLRTLETGSEKPMPLEWIDKDTGHKIVRLSRLEGNNASFYFHNNPFLTGQKGGDDKMIFYNTNKNQKQIFSLDLKTLEAEQITRQHKPMNGEIVAHKKREVYYQVGDSVYATHVDNKQTRFIFAFPADFKASITTINADETLLAGVWGDPREKDILKQYPEKRDFFTKIFEAKLPHTLFTVNIQTGELKKIHTESTWLGHVQFSPTQPDLLMFCHEGPWHLVDRIWHINVISKDIKKMHTRTVDGEIAGHEFWNPDGKIIWFDLQKPRSVTFYLAGADVATGNEKLYQMTRDEWSIHFNVSSDQKKFTGDGGNDTQVAKAKDGMWIYLFRPEGDHLQSERLVNMKHHRYNLEPNVHFSPDDDWIIFRANFEGESQVYAVKVKKEQ